MQEIREKLDILLKKHGMGYKEISLRLGKNQTYIQQFITKGIPRKLDGDLRKEICHILGEPENALEQPQKEHPPQKEHEITYEQTNTTPLMASDKVPVYGYAAGSTDRIAINDGRIVGMRERGPALAYAKDGFYVTVIGDSMEPRLRAGEYVAINPALPPIKGDECVIQFINGEAVVKTYVSQTAEKLYVTQFNPAKKLEYNMREILSVQPVVAIEKGR